MPPSEPPLGMSGTFYRENVTYYAVLKVELKITGRRFNKPATNLPLPEPRATVSDQWLPAPHLRLHNYHESDRPRRIRKSNFQPASPKKTDSPIKTPLLSRYRWETISPIISSHRDIRNPLIPVRSIVPEVGHRLGCGHRHRDGPHSPDKFFLIP